MSFRVREAKASDSEIFYRIRMHREYQQYFDGPGPESIDSHNQWFLEKTRGDNSLLLVAEVDGNPVGYSRFMRVDGGNTYEISYALDPKYLGQGWGTKSVVASICFLLEWRNVGAENTTVVAKIMRSNHRSKAVVTKAGFLADTICTTNTEDEGFGSQECEIYVLHLTPGMTYPARSSESTL